MEPREARGEWREECGVADQRVSDRPRRVGRGSQSGSERWGEHFDMV